MLFLIFWRGVYVKPPACELKDCAGDVWDAFQSGEDQPFYQCQIKHDVARSVCYQFKDKLSEFLRVTDGVPDDLNQLQENGIRIVVADKNDPEWALSKVRVGACVKICACCL